MEICIEGKCDYLLVIFGQVGIKYIVEDVCCWLIFNLNLNYIRYIKTYFVFLYSNWIDRNIWTFD